MRKSILIGAVALACFATPSFAMSDAECEALWKKADVNSDGVLSDTEAGRYLAAMRVGNVEVPADGRITSASFMEQCRKDVFKAMANDANAPLKGANSFTEGQARDRAEARGYSDVTGLKKDDDGIWRGTARMDGKSVGVAIDYKGNVVSDAGSAAMPTGAMPPASEPPAATPPTAAPSVDPAAPAPGTTPMRNDPATPSPAPVAPTR